MWFKTPTRAPDWATAVRHLRRDLVIRPVIQRVGPCTLHPRRDYFVVLCKSIFTQQISTKIATVLFGRFAALFPNKRPTPQRVLAALTGGVDDDTLRMCGLSRQKRSYLIDLARHFVDGRIPTDRLARMSDEEVIEALVTVKGIGRWTAEMFLIFTLNRPDVLPIDDLGLQKAVQQVYGLPMTPKPTDLVAVAEPWRPWRTLATWYLWRGTA